MDYSELDDSALMDLVARKQGDALSELYSRYGNLVFSVALRVVVDRETAEEITFDVFTRVWERAGLYQAERASMGTWLGSLARHRGIDELRRRNARPQEAMPESADDEPALRETGRGPEAMAEIDFQRVKIRAAMQDLPPEQRAVLELAYFHGLTHREIGEKLAQPLGTVKTRLRLAMQKLRQSLADEAESIE